MLTTDQVAKRLGVKARTVRYWPKSENFLDSVGRRQWRFYEDDIDDYVKRQRQK